ncbi:MAG: hypothetical protein EA366_08435 [Spirulina sp. DLM2.Bin59]|nr:MAG: hypothetical protein EA366_08435 [Spirulina sp. DLM2.Bin59]
MGSILSVGAAMATPMPFPEGPAPQLNPFPELDKSAPIPPAPAVAPEPAIAEEPPMATVAPQTEVPKTDSKVEFMSFADVAGDKSATLLLEPYSAPTAAAIVPRANPEIAQARNLFVNRPFNYVGGGINLGLSGNSDLGGTAWSIISRFALSNTLSLRPAAIINKNAVITVPLTYDFALPGADAFEPATIHPYVGGGIMFTTDDTALSPVKNNVGPMITGGLDLRLDDQWVLNAGLNIGFLGGDAEIGAVIGVGYIFGR